jgi:hypothetical protein
MEERLPLYENNQSAGLLLRREDGLHAVFTVDCPTGGGIRKVWLRSRNGGRMLLGTLAPEQGRWRLRRRVADSELRRQGLSEDIWGEILPAGGQPEQGGEKQQAVVPKDPVIAKALEQWNTGRWQKVKQGWRLGFPWQVGQRVPLEPLFCFARVGRGELYFLLNEEGFPI